MATIPKSQLMSAGEAAEMLGVARQTLADWRSSGRVRLPFVRVGGAVRYRLSDLELFISENTIQRQGGRP